MPADGRRSPLYRIAAATVLRGMIESFEPDQGADTRREGVGATQPGARI